MIISVTGQEDSSAVDASTAICQPKTLSCTAVQLSSSYAIIYIYITIIDTCVNHIIKFGNRQY